jgi:hypothetical protein
VYLISDTTQSGKDVMQELSVGVVSHPARVSPDAKAVLL